MPPGLCAQMPPFLVVRRPLGPFPAHVPAVPGPALIVRRSTEPGAGVGLGDPHILNAWFRNRVPGTPLGGTA